MPNTTIVAANGLTYVSATDHATYFVSLSTDSTASYVGYSTVVADSKPVNTLSGPPVFTSDIKVSYVGATPTSILASITSAPATPTTISTTTSAFNSTSGPLNGTTTSSGATGPTATHKAVPQKDTGAIVGAAVGCLIGGALIAGLLTWLIMSSRQKKKHRSSGGFSSERHRSSRANNEKALPSAPLLGGGAVGNWEKHLDQPESDNTIARSVKGLFDHIEVHVENYYRDAQVKITPELQNALMKVEGSKDLPDSVAGLLPNAQRPTMLIKHCIAHSIIEHIDSESDISDSFLPTDFIALPQALRTRRTTANKPGKLSLPSYTQKSSRSKLTESQHTIKPTHAGASSVPTSAPNPPKTQTIPTHETASSRPWLIGCAVCLIHGRCHLVTLAPAARI